MSDAIRVWGPRDGLQNEKTAVSVANRIAFVEKLLDAGWAPRASEHSPDRALPASIVLPVGHAVPRGAQTDEDYTLQSYNLV